MFNTESLMLFRKLSIALHCIFLAIRLQLLNKLRVEKTFKDLFEHKTVTASRASL